MNYLRMDLKVCEGCGGLWVRAGKEEGVYCKRCAARLVSFPVSRKRRPVARCNGRKVLAMGGAR